MSQISLSKSVRQNLMSLQQTADLMGVAQQRLSSGKRVNSAMDNASNYFTSSSLNSRASDLSNLLDGISNATKTLEAANNGITAIKKLVESAQSTMRQAAATDATDTTTLGKLETQYNETLSQIDKMAKDSGFNGVNLLDGGADPFKVTFNEKTGADKNELAIDHVDGSATGLGLTTIASGALDLTAAEANLDLLNTALTSLRSFASTFGSNATTIQIRQDFTKATVSTLKTGADNLVNADINEEAANLLALQTRQSISQSALSMANQQDQAVLRLFG